MITITQNYQKQKLGKGLDHVQRLTDKHANFKNLDPFRVLVLDTDATPDDIKNRYKKMSVLCHPDKNGGSDQAKTAFEAAARTSHSAHRPCCALQPAQYAHVAQRLAPKLSFNS